MKAASHKKKEEKSTVKNSTSHERKIRRIKVVIITAILSRECEHTIQSSSSLKKVPIPNSKKNKHSSKRKNSPHTIDIWSDPLDADALRWDQMDQLTTRNRNQRSIQRQTRKFLNSISNIRPSEILVIMDFSEGNVSLKMYTHHKTVWKKTRSRTQTFTNYFFQGVEDDVLPLRLQFQFGDNVRHETVDISSTNFP